MGRLPYIDDEAVSMADRYRRSAAIDRSEADGYAIDDPMRQKCLDSAREFDSLAERESILDRARHTPRGTFRATLTATTNEYLKDRLPCEGIVQIVETDIYKGVTRALFMPDPEPGAYTSFVQVPDAQFTFASRV